MRRIILLLMFIILFTSVVSADVIITQQPKELYNLGDTINIPMKITTLTGISNLFTVNLICNGISKEVFKEYLALPAGGEVARAPTVPLIESFIGRPTGTCVLKAIWGAEVFELTQEFTISDKINILLRNEKTEATPEENIIIEGEAIKDNGAPVQGVIELKVIEGNQSINEVIDTVKNGYFYINFSFPKETKAGQYLVSIDIYEHDLEAKKTNKGFINYNLLIAQVPTSLEIVFEEPIIDPGTSLRVKTILHDQTGISMDSTSVITIKNNRNEILEQIDMPTNEFLEFPVVYNEPAAKWKVVAVSNKLTTEAAFNISEKEDIEIVLINRTVTIVNTGNVIYCNKSILIKIGNKSINVDVCLEVDQDQEYLLTAPEGEYQVEIISDEEERISKNVMLTGRSIDVKEAKANKRLRFSFIWVFIIAVLGFVAYLFFKKGYKKNFFGYISKKKEKKGAIPLIKNSQLNTRNKAELSLSIKGDKQNISLVCLKIKDLKDMGSKKGGAGDTLQKIIDLAEEKKAAIYETNDNLFILLAPVKTKTFNNEKTAVELGQKIEVMLNEHNKLFKDKLDFGIALNYGTIVAKSEKDVLKFMSMGTLITTAKKTASFSKGEILLGEKIHDKLRASVKTEKQTHGNTTVYSIKEVKNREDHKGFLSNFVKRLEKEKKEKEDKEKKSK